MNIHQRQDPTAATAYDVSPGTLHAMATPKVRTVRRLALVVVATLAANVVCYADAVASTTTNVSETTTTYEASNALIANPERGFYHHTGDCDKSDFVASTLVGYRANEKISLVMCIFYLAEFKTTSISQAQLDRFQRQAATVRAAGLKMIVRFAYTKSTAGDDVPLSRVQAHLGQLAPYLQSNSDVIDVVQSGFVGAWGEGYYTQNFGNGGLVSDANWADRKAIVDKLLNILPTTRKVQVRTPSMKRRMYGMAATTSADVTAGTAVARIGHHNDCFLASRTDAGTYQDTAVEYPYLAADTQYVPMGGETCGTQPNPPRSDCPTALDELSMFHYSYLNRDWSPAVLDSWEAGECMAQINRRLGYRFTLVSVTSATTVTRGTNMAFGMTIRNDGWSGAINLRPVRLVLRNTTTDAVYTLPLTGTRNWHAGTTLNFVHNGLTIPATIPVGTYALLLNIPDPASALANKPEYAVRLANTGLWEPSTGFNSLTRTVLVQ